jgi:hypothetical protein
VRQPIQKGGTKWGQTNVDYGCRDRECASTFPTGCDEMPITAILNMAQRYLQPAFIRPASHVKDQK